MTVQSVNALLNVMSGIHVKEQNLDTAANGYNPNTGGLETGRLRELADFPL